MKFPAHAISFWGRRRVPVIRQVEAAECGLACLAMIANYHGRKTNLAALRLQHSISRKGCTLKSLIAVSDKMQLLTRPLRVKLSDLKKLRLPCILHWEMNHFVVLNKISGKEYHINDPAAGENIHSRGTVSQKFSGVALELYPAAEFSAQNDFRSMRVSDLWSDIDGLWRTGGQVLLLSVIIQAFSLAAPFYMQVVIDHVVATSDADLLLVLASGFGLLVLLKVITTALRSSVVLHAGSLLSYQMISNLFQHLLRLPVSWFEKRHVGDIVSRFSSTRPVCSLLTEGIVNAVVDGAMAMVTIIIIFLYHPVLGVVVSGAFCAYLILRIVLYRPLRRANEQQIVSTAHEQTVFMESVRGVQSLKMFGQEQARTTTWQNRLADVVTDTIAVGKIRIGADALNQFVFGIENILVIFAGASLVLDGRLSVGALVAIISYKQHFGENASALVERLIEYRLLGLHLDRISDIGLAVPERGTAAPPRVSLAGTGVRCARLELRNVSFRYAESDPWLLKDISLQISGGEMIAFAGHSGCGKSTLLKIMLGLLQPERGEVLYGGQNVASSCGEYFRHKVGSVMQGDSLFAGSIADNISFFDTEPDPALIRAAAQAAAIDSDIEAMPMAYNTLIGDMGCLLSAGQKQRVLLARALYRKPHILVLDEGTANLDVPTEHRIVDLVRRLNITRLCVAHRNAILAAADRTIVLDAGRLREVSSIQLH